MKIKKGDKVKVISGKYRGSEGLVTGVLTKKDRVLVEGVNVKKRTLKKKEETGNENFIFIQHSIHSSNVVKVEVASESKEVKKVKKTTKKSEASKKTSTKAK